MDIELLKKDGVNNILLREICRKTAELTSLVTNMHCHCCGNVSKLYAEERLSDLKEIIETIIKLKTDINFDHLE